MAGVIKFVECDYNGNTTVDSAVELYPVADNETPRDVIDRVLESTCISTAHRDRVLQLWDSKEEYENKIFVKLCDNSGRCEDPSIDQCEWEAIVYQED